MQVKEEAPDEDGSEPIRGRERGVRREGEAAYAAIQVDMGSMS